MAQGKQGALARKKNDIASAPVARSCVRHLPRAMKRFRVARSVDSRRPDARTSIIKVKVGRTASILANVAGGVAPDGRQRLGYGASTARPVRQRVHCRQVRTHIPTGRHSGDTPHAAAVSVSPIFSAFVGADPPVSTTSNPLEIWHSQIAGSRRGVLPCPWGRGVAINQVGRRDIVPPAGRWTARNVIARFLDGR
jgi:hypothetical protein